MDNKTYKLLKNEYVTKGICVYEDDYDNRLHMIKKEGAFGNKLRFVAKLRFNNKMVKSNPITINVPLDGEEGTNLHIDYLDGIDRSNEEEIKSAIEMATAIIQRWIAMMYDIFLLNMNPGATKLLNPNLSNEDIARMKIENLAVYEELSEVVNGVMGNFDHLNTHI